jgi:aldose 1-epimerase
MRRAVPTLVAFALACIVTATATATAAAQPGATRAAFGQLRDGRQVEAVTLHGAGGIRAVILNYGATVQSVLLPDRDGKLADVIVGPGSLQPYLDNPQYFGATVGRFANRLAGGAFTLDGQTYHTPRNNDGNALHGGERGFDKVLWEIVEVSPGQSGGQSVGDAGESVTLRYVSPAGDQGYPGTMTALAIYSLKGTQLSIEYRATTDAPTIVNLSNHSYWNLAGEGSPRSAIEQLLTIRADTFLPVNAGLIPTGEFRQVNGTPFDFRAPRRIGDRVREADEQIVRGRGYDHNFVIARGVGAEPRRVARLEDPVSGRAFELWSDQPGLQFYSGNFLDGTTIGKSGRLYRQGDAVVLEPQLFPDTPNQPAFGSARLAPGAQYRSRIVYRFESGAGPRKSD